MFRPHHRLLQTGTAGRQGDISRQMHSFHSDFGFPYCPNAGLSGSPAVNQSAMSLSGFRASKISARSPPKIHRQHRICCRVRIGQVQSPKIFFNRRHRTVPLRFGCGQQKLAAVSRCTPDSDMRIGKNSATTFPSCSYSRQSSRSVTYN